MTVQLDEQADPAPVPDPTPRPVKQLVLISLAAVLVVGAGLLAAGWDRGTPPWAGRVLESTQAKPDITLTDTSGRPFNLRTDTAGKLTVLMFGYTHCPDVCPINLATLDSTLDSLGPRARGQVEMVFVTADPARDTPEVLRTYLDQFDVEFIGLTGTEAEVAAAQEAAKVPIATLDQPDAKGDYTVGHATQMIVYGTDDQARIVYPFGTRQVDWSRDLPRLLNGEEPTA